MLQETVLYQSSPKMSWYTYKSRYREFFSQLLVVDLTCYTESGTESVKVKIVISG